MITLYTACILISGDELLNNVARDCDDEVPCNNPLDLPLYAGASVTVRSSIAGHLSTMINTCMTKQSLTQICQTTADNLLPQPNRFPRTYESLITRLKKELVTVHKKNVCKNDCIIYIGDEENKQRCPKCFEPRYQNDSLGRRVAVRYFSHLSIGEYLTKRFGCSNIAQIMQSAGGCQPSRILRDITDGRFWEENVTANDDHRPGTKNK